MNESEKQFSFIRAASSTSGRAKKQIQLVKIACDEDRQPFRGCRQRVGSPAGAKGRLHTPNPI
jgi:hypothetical protein